MGYLSLTTSQSTTVSATTDYKNITLKRYDTKIKPFTAIWELGWQFAIEIHMVSMHI